MLIYLLSILKKIIRVWTTCTYNPCIKEFSLLSEVIINSAIIDILPSRVQYRVNLLGPNHSCNSQWRTV